MLTYKVVIWEKVVHEFQIEVDPAEIPDDDERQEYAVDQAKEMLGSGVEDLCEDPCVSYEAETWDFETTECEVIE